MNINIKIICSIFSSSIIIKDMQVQAKVEEDAILIEDDNLIPQFTNVSALNYLPKPGMTSFDTRVKLCKQNHIYQEEDSQVTILRRLSKFFEYNKKIEPGNEYFTVKKQPNNQLALIDNQIIIFGCDFKKLKLVRKEYLTTQSVIINPSNFKLVYPDRGTAWKAIQANALDPKALAKKRQSQDDSLPRCWIEMRPYTFHNRTIKVFVRYATEDERNVQPMKERWSYMYNKCRDIYNTQEEERKARQILDQERRRERLEKNPHNEQKQIKRRELQKQINSNLLYEHYNSLNSIQWKKGKNSNPGAHKQDNRRDNSRSRSRSKEKCNKLGQLIQNDSSVMQWQNLTQINNGINSIQIEDGENPQPQVPNLSFEINGSKQRSQYQWNGKKTDLSTKYNWSYSEYMKKVEQQEELSRSQIIIINLDD